MGRRDFVINRCYHVKGWRRGTNFRLVEISSDNAILERPLHRKKQKFVVPLNRLVNTLRHGGQLVITPTNKKAGK